MKSQASIDIDRPIEDVFHFTITDVVRWSTIVVQDEVVGEQTEGVGTRFRTVTEERGRRMTFDGVVTQHEPPHRHAVRMVGKSFDIEVEYRFEQHGTATRVSQTADVNGKGLFKLLFGLLGWLMVKSSCDAAQKELANLKRVMEES